MKKRFAELGVEGVGSTSKEFAQFVQRESAKWAGVIRASGIKAD
jgi:tripartite-type tricarboxylate transporter receptor subunit TctC